MLLVCLLIVCEPGPALFKFLLVIHFLLSSVCDILLRSFFLNFMCVSEVFLSIQPSIMAFHEIVLKCNL